MEPTEPGSECYSWLNGCACSAEGEGRDLAGMLAAAFTVGNEATWEGDEGEKDEWDGGYSGDTGCAGVFPYF